MLLRFLISYSCLTLLLGCAVSAPMLPPDYSSTNSKLVLNEAMFEPGDLERECSDIIAEKLKLQDTRRKLDEANTENRGREQSLGLAAVLLFSPALVVVGDNKKQQQEIHALQQRYDYVNHLLTYKGCDSGFNVERTKAD